MADAQPQPNDETSESLRQNDQEILGRLAQLEQKVEEKDQRIDELERQLDTQQQQPTVEMEPGNLESLTIGNVPVGLALTSKLGESDLEHAIGDIVESTIDDQVNDIREEFRTSKAQYSRQAAMLQKRFTALEEELEVDTMELVTDDDHISRFITNGPEDVFPRVYEKQKRARKMLMNAKDWGTVVNDQLGDRVVFKASTVKPFLKTEYDREFNSTEVKRIFGVVEELGEMSTREVSLDKNDENEHRLAVWGV